jgi:hypothetical protein
MSQAQALAAALDAACKALIRQIEWDYRTCARIVESACAEKLAGNLPEARILLNQALDIEFSVTGDCQILGPIAEEWEVVYERDQRNPDPPPKPMKCPLCPADMERADYTHVTTVGALTVTHETALAWMCSACGRASLSSDELFGYEREAAIRLLRMPGPVSGEVLKFARKVLGLRKEELEQRLGWAGGQVDFFERRPLVAKLVGLAMIALIEGTALPEGSNPGSGS